MSRNRTRSWRIPILNETFWLTRSIFVVVTRRADATRVDFLDILSIVRVTTKPSTLFFAFIQKTLLVRFFLCKSNKPSKRFDKKIVTACSDVHLVIPDKSHDGVIDPRSSNQ